MSWQKHTIKLGTAQRIFSQFNIQEVFIGEKLVGYEALFDNHYVTGTGLTALCERLVQMLIDRNL